MSNGNTGPWSGLLGTVNNWDPSLGKWGQQQAAKQAQAGNSQAAAQGVSTVSNRTGATGTNINDPGVNPNAYQYGGHAGGAAAQNQYYQGLAGAQAAQQGAQIQNQYDPRDQAQMQGTLGSLGSFYQGQMNGTGPSLASAQMQQATDQGIAAQMAAANSARGGLAGAAAQRQAAQQGASMQQNAAQQSMQGRIQEEYNAAQGMQGVGQLSLGEQQANMQAAAQQAQLQQQQQDINARAGLGYAGLENQVNTEQMNAQMQQQAQQSGNYLSASGMGMSQSQFDTQQANNLGMGALGAGAGLLLAFADADFVEPPGADMRPAHDTLREQRTVDGRPFIAIADQNTGVVEKLATSPLSHAEARRVAEPHGAGPIFAQGAARAHTTFHDMPMAAMPRPMPAGMTGPMMPARSTLGPRGVAPMPIGGMMMQQPRPVQMPGGGMMASNRPMPGGGIPPQAVPPPGGMMLAQPTRMVPDMDLSAARHRVYHDAIMSPYGAPSTMVMPPGSLPPSGGPMANPYGPSPAEQQFPRTMALPDSAYAPHPTAQALPDNPYSEPTDSGLAGAAGRAIGSGAPGQLSGLPGARTPPPSAGPSKLNLAGQDLLKSSLSRMGSGQPTAMQSPQAYGGLAGSAGFTPMQVPTLNPYADVDLGGAMFPSETDRMYGLLGSARIADMDLGDPGMMPSIPHAANAMSPIGSRPPPGAVTAGMAGLQDHMRRLQAADADLKSRAKLGSGKRFAHLEHSLAARPGVHDAGALAASIGRHAHPHTFQHLAAAGRK